jgi:hypothetical protein
MSSNEPTAEELEQQIADSQKHIENEVEASGTPEEQPSETTEPEIPSEEKKDRLSWTAEDGTTYYGETDEELNNAIRKAVNDGKSYAKRLKEERDKPAPTPEKTVDEPRFEQNKYLTLLRDDALKAEEYKKQFDPDIRDLRARRKRDDLTERQNEEYRQFYADTGYAAIDTKEANAAMREYLEEKGWIGSGDIISHHVLARALYELQRDGRIPRPIVGRPAEKKRPNPSPPSGSTDSERGETGWPGDNASAKEMLEHLRKVGVEGAEYERIN